MSLPSSTSGVPSPAPTTAATVAAVVAQDPAALERDLAALFVQALNLEVAAADIDPAAPLFGDGIAGHGEGQGPGRGGLGLDSIDILEVALEVSQRYGFQLRSDDENNQQIFQSLRSLAAHVALHRTQ